MIKRYFFDVIVESYAGDIAKYGIHVLARHLTEAKYNAEIYSQKNMGLKDDDQFTLICTGDVGTTLKKMPKKQLSFMEELKAL